MRNILTSLFCGLTLALAAAPLKLSSILTADLWQKGYSATVKTSSSLASRSVVEPYTLYMDGDQNSRIDNQNSITIYRSENGLDKVYSYDKISKTYTVQSSTDLTDDDLTQDGELEKPASLNQEQQVEKVASEKFAGIQCDKFRIINPGEEKSTGEHYLFVDPTRKVLTGLEVKTAELSLRLEYTDLKFNVDKTLFKPLPGYKKVN